MAYTRRIFSINFATSTANNYKNRWGKISGGTPDSSGDYTYKFASGSILFDLQEMTDFYNRRDIITGDIVLYLKYTTLGNWFALGEKNPERAIYPKKGRTTTLNDGDRLYAEGPLMAPGLWGSITALSAEETYGGYSYNLKITFPFSRLVNYYNGDHSEDAFKNGFFLKGGYLIEKGKKGTTNSSTVLDISVPVCMEYTTTETETTYTYNVSFNTNNQYSSQTFPMKSYTYKTLSSTAPSITVALPSYQYEKVSDPDEVREFTHIKWNKNSSGTSTSYNIGGNITLTNGKINPTQADAVKLYGVWNSSLIDENEVIYIDSTGTPRRFKLIYSDGTTWHRTKAYYCDGTQFIKCTAPIG